jgi:hypothetical protein
MLVVYTHAESIAWVMLIQYMHLLGVVVETECTRNLHCLETITRSSQFNDPRLDGFYAYPFVRLSST